MDKNFLFCIIIIYDYYDDFIGVAACAIVLFLLLLCTCALCLRHLCWQHLRKANDRPRFN